MSVSVKRRLQTAAKMRTEGIMQTEDCRPGVKCRLGSKTTRLPGKTSRVSLDRGHESRQRMIIIIAIDVANFTSSDGFGVDVLFFKR